LAPVAISAALPAIVIVGVCILLSAVIETVMSSLSLDKVPEGALGLLDVILTLGSVGIVSSKITEVSSKVAITEVPALPA
jgi:hypothetical protein